MSAHLPEGDWIHGISIKRPWTTAVLTGAKTIENRPRPWRNGWVLLHAGQQTDRPALRLPLVTRTIRDRQLVTGAVVGVARITGCHQDPDGAPLCSPWAHPKAWHLELAAVEELPLPVPARGQLGPWKPTSDLLTRCSSSCPTSGRETHSR
ncbi:hypothetical protein YW3DRAFT_06530 [Streptomyces sp. MnatMP-M77]|nr:hypothetical protein YW3DRAFT_06530 [Streptomyces sp. MnatMP-M77]